MDWRIQAADPTAPADLKTVLEAARDKWVETTPQLSDKFVEKLDDQVARSHNENRKPAVELRAEHIKNGSKTLDKTHLAVVRQMDAAITAACATASAMGETSVRVGLSGHVKDVARDGVYERIRIEVDHAAHG